MIDLQLGEVLSSMPPQLFGPSIAGYLVIGVVLLLAALQKWKARSRMRLAAKAPSDQPSLA